MAAKTNPPPKPTPPPPFIVSRINTRSFEVLRLANGQKPDDAPTYVGYCKASESAAYEIASVMTERRAS